MKFSLIVSKSANFYFFIQNLAEWHFSNQKDYNILWRNELDSFSPEEENALRVFKEIRLRYKPSRTPFELAFFTTKNPWEDLKKNLISEEYQTVRKIFGLFENKFASIWNKDSHLLYQWQKVLNKDINNHFSINATVNILNILFNTTPSESEIKIYLLFSSPNHTGGGANIDNESISLEISRYPIQGVNHAIGIIWHETTHLCFQNQYFFSLVLKQLPNEQQKVDLINEIVISSLFPKGILGIRLLKNKPAHTLMAETGTDQTIKILNLTKEYIDKQKSLDEKYIGVVAEILKM